MNNFSEGKTYDSAYLAAVEVLHAEFWTVDHHLASSAHRADATWTKSIFDS